MRLKKKYVNAKLVCNIADSIAEQVGDKSAKIFSRLLKKSLKAIPGIKTNDTVKTDTIPEQEMPDKAVIGSVEEFMAAIRGDIRVVAELPSGEVVFSGYLDDCLYDEFEDYDITGIRIQNGLARVFVKEKVRQEDFVVIDIDAV